MVMIVGWGRRGDDLRETTEIELKTPGSLLHLGHKRAFGKDFGDSNLSNWLDGGTSEKLGK